MMRRPPQCCEPTCQMFVVKMVAWLQFELALAEDEGRAGRLHYDDVSSIHRSVAQAIAELRTVQKAMAADRSVLFPN